MGGLALGGGGVYLLVEQPLGKNASYALSGVGMGFGFALLFFYVPESFRAGSSAARASRPWSFAAARLPGGGVVGATLAF